MGSAFRWYGFVFLPVILLLLAAWSAQNRSIRRDADAGAPVRRGLPHHGPIMVRGIQALLSLPLLWLQIGWTIRLGMEREVIWFGVAALVAMVPNLLAIQLLRWMERAPSPEPLQSPIPQTS